MRCVSFILCVVHYFCLLNCVIIVEKIGKIQKFILINRLNERNLLNMLLKFVGSLSSKKLYFAVLDFLCAASSL